MRILYCIPTLLGGGAERQVRLLVKEFARRGEVVGLLTRFSPSDHEEFCDLSVECIPVGEYGNHSPKLAVTLGRELSRGSWDVVQSWILQMDVLVGLCAPFSDFRWILSERSAPQHYSRGWKNALRKRLASRADLIVANSANGLAYWADASVPSVVIPNAIDLSAIRAVPRGRDSAEVGDLPLLLSVGRLDQWKNFEVLIRAQAVLRARGIQARLTILGEGPSRLSLAHLIRQLNLEDRIDLPGFSTDVLSWLARADLYVSTSLYEGQPNAVLEAAASKVPTILSHIPEHQELMEGAAIFVAPNDPEDVASGIARLLGDPRLCQLNAEVAFSRVARQSIEVVAARYLECYADLL